MPHSRNQLRQRPKILTIIPARGGSKGVAGKNLKTVCGQPLIDYTFESAFSCPVLTEGDSQIWLSSDDESILAHGRVCAEKFDLNIHRRDAELASDKSPITDTLKAVIDTAGDFDWLLLLQVTAPIRDKEHIEGALEHFDNCPEAASLVSVVAMDDVHPARMYWQKPLGEMGKGLEAILPQWEASRRQDIPKAYYRNGSLYLVKIPAFLKSGVILARPTLSYEMPESMLLNIDTLRDILIAEPLIKAWKEGRLL